MNSYINLNKNDIIKILECIPNDIKFSVDFYNSKGMERVTINSDFYKADEYKTNND